MAEHSGTKAQLSGRQYNAGAARDKHLSTTALARQLGKESKELFVLLAKGGWMAKVDGHWQLTEKGKFEGGVYVNHPKYGEYIAWPEAIAHHPLLQLLPEAPLTASNLAAKWDIPARLVNLLLAERGLVKKYVRGWHITAQGMALGGQQQEAEHTGTPYVSWPETLLEDVQLQHLLQQLHGEPAAPQQAQASVAAIDGQRVNNALQRRLANWLYLARVVYARDYAVYLTSAASSAKREPETLIADFYIPEARLCIECWGDALASHHNGAAAVADELTKDSRYKQYRIDYLQLQDETITQLDELLARELLKRGLAVY